MPELVHVKDKATGHEYVVTRTRFDRSPELWTETGKSPLGPDGLPVPAKHKTTVAKSAAAKNRPGQQSATTEGKS